MSKGKCKICKKTKELAFNGKCGECIEHDIRTHENGMDEAYRYE